MEIVDSAYSNKYEDFHLNEIKELKSFDVVNYIINLILLNDGRILTNESDGCDEDSEEENEEENKEENKEENEKGKEKYKLCVHSLINGFDCDINIDFELVRNFYLMNDGNVLVNVINEIKIIKIKKNTIEEIWKEKKKGIRITKLLNENFFFKIKEDKQRLLYKYDNGKLISYKNIKELFFKESVDFLYQINENEYVLFSNKKGIIYGTNNYLLFYDMKNDKKIKSLKIGDGKKNFCNFFSLSKDILIIFGFDSNLLVDVKNKKIINEFKFELYLDQCIFLNEKLFLYFNNFKLLLFEYKEPNNIILKEEKKISGKIELASKYPGNQLIMYLETKKNKKLSIYG